MKIFLYRPSFRGSSLYKNGSVRVVNEITDDGTIYWFQVVDRETRHWVNKKSFDYAESAIAYALVSDKLIEKPLTLSKIKKIVDENNCLSVITQYDYKQRDREKKWGDSLYSLKRIHPFDMYQMIEEKITGGKYQLCFKSYQFEIAGYDPVLNLVYIQSDIILDSEFPVNQDIDHEDDDDDVDVTCLTLPSEY